MIHQERRALLRSALGLALVSQSSGGIANAPPVAHTTHIESGSNAVADEISESSVYISGARTVDGQYLGVLFDEHAELIATMPLTSRAHGAASHRVSEKVVIFARRPGVYMSAFHLSSPETQQHIEASEGRHFYGHGVFSPSGAKLYATENDFDNSRGVLGVYDSTRKYKRLGEVDTGGIGPHEVISIPGTDTLAVANGGIRTHPDAGREKLNVETMQASITLINSRTGTVVATHVLPDELHQLSIRHLVYAGDGKLWFAGQYEGTNTSSPGLAGCISIGKSMQSYKKGVSSAGLVLANLPASLQARTQHYLSSVAVSGDSVVYTSARGGVAFSINRNTHELQEIVSIVDCSGVAAEIDVNNRSTIQKKAFIVTAGTGEVLQMSPKGVASIAMHRLQWDNHLYRV